MPDKSLRLDGGSLTLAGFMAVVRERAEVEATPEAIERVRRARGVVERILEDGQVVYGVSTGFGKFSNVSIEKSQLADLQVNLVRSHAAGVGRALDESVVRGMMVLKANEICRGHGGARVEVVEALVRALNAGLFPVVPEQGSVGASGDLAPLAHVALCLLGEGQAFHEGRPRSSKEVLGELGLEPLALAAKDGLSLINGTQLTTSLLAQGVARVERLARTADVVAAMSLDALLGSEVPFREEVQVLRPHPGQQASAANLRRLLRGSALILSHADCDRVQDAYSLRCTPQVHGATREALAYARRIVDTELNACTDNPLIFPDRPPDRSGDPGAGEEDGAGGPGESWAGHVDSAGNFHAQIPAHAADSLTLAVTQLAGISERRLERLVNPALSEGLPAFLVRDGGLHSGLMMAQVTAAALVSECRTLSNPASSQSISTSADQEDFVSMGPVAGRQLLQTVEASETVLAIEFMAACQALDLRQPVESSPQLEAAHELLREHVAFLDRDRVLAGDIEKAADLVRDGSILGAVAEALAEPGLE